MKNRFREARIKAGLKTNDAAKKLGVCQPTLSSWERGVKNPTLDNLILMSNLYGVSIDYLLDRVSLSPIPNSLMVSSDVLSSLNGKPVWVPDKGWGLVNSHNHDVLFNDGTKTIFAEIMTSYIVSENSCDSLNPLPLTKEELLSCNTVWIEPLTDITEIKESLKGWYSLKGQFFENEFGNRFAISTYSANWIAYKDRL